MKEKRIKVAKFLLLKSVDIVTLWQCDTAVGLFSSNACI